MNAFHFLYVALVPLSLLAGVAGIRRWFRASPSRIDPIVRFLGVGAALGIGVAWIWRWAEAGHLPLFGTYESALSLAIGGHVVALAVSRLRPGRSFAVVPVAHLSAALLLLHGSGFGREIYALTISERSWVVDLHAFSAWLAFGALVANAGVALRRVLPRAPEGEGTERLLAETLAWGFLLHTAMMTTGSLYKFLLFGRAWSFDPIETMGFAVWVAYGALLHLSLMAGWRGRRLAAWCLVVFAMLVVSYRCIVYFPAWSTYHIFDMDRRIHIRGEAMPTPENPIVPTRIGGVRTSQSRQV